MGNSCHWCNKKTPYVHITKVKVATHGSKQKTKENLVICKKCEQDLREYERSWEVLSH